MKYRHLAPIPMGTKGELSYIEEEFAELKDAHAQKAPVWTLIESSDMVRSVGLFAWRHYRVPLLLVVLLSYVRVPYKFVRNRILDACGVKKKHR